MLDSIEAIMEAGIKQKYTSKVLLNYLLNVGKVTCSLPLDSGSSFILKLLNGIGCIVLTFNVIGIILSLLSTVYINLHKRILITELLGTLMIYLEYLCNVLLWRFKRKDFQKFLQEFNDFIATPKQHEREIINKYFNRYKYFHLFFITFAFASFIIRIIIAPILQPQKLPLPIYYPFEIKPYTAVHFIIHLSQSIAALQSTSQILFPIIVAIIFLHALMKLELLVHNLKKVKNENQLVICIQQHLECIQLIERINSSLGPIIMKTYVILGLSVIFGSIKFIYNPNIYIIIKTFVTITSCLLGAYIYNGPADDIYEMSQVIGFSLYDMEWNEELVKMRKSIIIIMSRVQKPLFISPLKGIMPALNRKIYTNFISYLVSYIMTLRAIVSTQV